MITKSHRFTYTKRVVNELAVKIKCSNWWNCLTTISTCAQSIAFKKTFFNWSLVCKVKFNGIIAKRTIFFPKPLFRGYFFLPRFYWHRTVSSWNFRFFFNLFFGKNNEKETKEDMHCLKLSLKSAPFCVYCLWNDSNTPSCFHAKSSSLVYKQNQLPKTEWLKKFN